ncbi:hypothetical protein [Asticcacaulis benevestitus]|uniref:Uncharacterized protein n=1 Tax=Asticcacaulis benevestitus DSM 16100 = ATCC BAA-896 TaxID=1121022 RepID=V4REF8_9CAUL|nr:hypothetical protein [Asticcacaulis benevestitus]ESQ89768.1 hypothetical protein ABENE_13580 [Asticcacaulis benevestitus DSM 16100 = ATCC BAA-896]
MANNPTQNGTIQDWIKDKYYASLATTAATNVSYLNTTVAWAVSLMTGALALVLSHEKFPDKPSVGALAVLLIVIGHFFVRASKAYTNMMRFTTLEKSIIKSILNDECGDRTAKEIAQYHVGWHCPLPRRKIALKVLTELGFGYFFLIVIGLLIWTLFKSSPEWSTCFGLWIVYQPKCFSSNQDAFMGLLTGVSFAIPILEILWMFFRSPYFKNIDVLKIAKEQG